MKESGNVLTLAAAREAYGLAGIELFSSIQSLVTYLVTNFPENAVLPLLNSVLARAKDLSNPELDIGSVKFNWVEFAMPHFARNTLSQRKARAKVFVIGSAKVGGLWGEYERVPKHHMRPGRFP